jgi:hypothetical protein
VASDVLGSAGLRLLAPRSTEPSQTWTTPEGRPVAGATALTVEVNVTGCPGSDDGSLDTSVISAWPLTMFWPVPWSRLPLPPTKLPSPL